ncbi:hypothetical protein RF11_01407 [Thelohanellus kitauei]|uniref:Uncharacterized protein n=1 Tax=Thelohanellus kitauei TaxID=669202 RepID=A0A0C2ND11_THEKT|nr:hypothetical protein RF11_01407 [Thelohanellus kitauei]
MEFTRFKNDVIYYTVNPGKVNIVFGSRGYALNQTLLKDSFLAISQNYYNELPIARTITDPNSSDQKIMENILGQNISLQNVRAKTKLKAGIAKLSRSLSQEIAKTTKIPWSNGPIADVIEVSAPVQCFQGTLTIINDTNAHDGCVVGRRTLCNRKCRRLDIFKFERWRVSPIMSAYKRDNIPLNSFIEDCVVNLVPEHGRTKQSARNFFPVNECCFGIIALE